MTNPLAAEPLEILEIATGGGSLPPHVAAFPNPTDGMDLVNKDAGEVVRLIREGHAWAIYSADSDDTQEHLVAVINAALGAHAIAQALRMACAEGTFPCSNAA